MKEEKKSFLLYLEHKELINELSDEESGKLFKKLFEYVDSGVTPELNGMSKMAFISIRQDLDRNKEKYEQKLIAQRENGKKGGRPKKKIETENQIVLSQTEENPKNPMVFSETQKSLYDNDNVNVNDNDNDNDNDNVNENVNEISSSSSSSYLQEEKIKNDLITEEEKNFLKTHIRLNRKDVKNVDAYADKMIANGDYLNIISKYRDELFKTNFIKEKKQKEEQRKIEDEKLKLQKEAELKQRKKKEEEDRKNLIQKQLSEIKNRESCAKIPMDYIDDNGDGVPEEFDKFRLMYDLDTPEKIRKTFFENLRKRYNIPKIGVG